MHVSYNACYICYLINIVLNQIVIQHFMYLLVQQLLCNVKSCSHVSIVRSFVFYLNMKTCLYNVDPLKPHFYIVKLEFTGYTLFSLLC